MKNRIPLLLGAVCAPPVLGLTAKASDLNFGDPEISGSSRWHPVR